MRLSYPERPRAAALAALLTAGALAGCRPSPTAAPTEPAAGSGIPVTAPSTTGAARRITPNLDPCDNDVTRALGTGLKEFATEEEGVALLPGTMLWPAAGTVPDGWTFEKGYYNAQMTLGGKFKQSTMGLIYQTGENAEWEISILYMNQYLPFEEPREPHETITVRGKTAYLFKPPFRETLNSVQWKEDCRLVSVIADLPVDKLLEVAAGLRTRAPGDGSAASASPAAATAAP